MSEQGIRHLHARIAAVAMLTVLLLLGIGLRSAFAESPSPAASASRVVLKIGVTSDAVSLNPFSYRGALSWEALNLTYNMLYDVDTENHVRAQLAVEVPTLENGGISADGMTYTIKLKPELKWSDGEPLTAEDVRWTFEFCRKNVGVLGGLAFPFMAVKKTTALDETTVQIEFNEPRVGFEYTALTVLPKHIWGRMSPEEAAAFANEPPIVGSGPFCIAHYKAGSYMSLERNPNYWGQQPAVEEVVYAIYQNPQTMVFDLESGVLDAADGLSALQFKQVDDLPDVEGVPYNYRDWEYLCINCFQGATSDGHPVLRDVEFRQALNWAVDREKLSTVAYNGFAEPATTIMPPDTWINPDFHFQPAEDALYGFDLEKANQLLDEAGYARNAEGKREFKGKPIELRLYTRVGFPQEEAAAKLIVGWFRDVGLQVDLSVVDEATMFDAEYSMKGSSWAPNYDMFISNWPGFADIGTTLDCFTSEALQLVYSEPGWTNAEYDDLWVKQYAAIDPEERKELIWRMQEIFYEESPHLVLVYPQRLQAYNTEKWVGWTRTLNGNGPAFWAQDNQDSYVNLKPATAATGADAGGSSTTLIIVAICAAAIIALVAVIALRRRSHARQE